MHRNRQEATVLGWMKSLPEELFQARPVLSILYVAAIMSNGQIEGVEVRLRNAERWLDIISGNHEPFDNAQDLRRPKDMIFVNEAEFRRLPGAIAMYRAGQALALANLPDTMTYARRVFDSLRRRTISGAGRQQRSWDLPSGRAGIWRQRTSRLPRTWRSCKWPGTSPTRLEAYLPWQIYGSRRVVSTMPSVSMRGHCN
jgi:hypothetical protein